MFDKVQMSPSEFATEVVKEARKRGFNAMVFVDGKQAYTGNVEGIFYGTDKPAVIKPHQITLADLHDYIKKAKTDDVVGHYTPKEWSSIPNYHMHIYSAKNQVNILNGPDPQYAETIACFVFDDDSAALVRVDEHGRANYDDPMRMDIDTAIRDISWTAAFGSRGGTIKHLIHKLFNNPGELLDKLEENAITFDDFRMFCKWHLTPGTMYTFSEPDGREWGLMNSKEDPSDIYMYYIPKEGSRPEAQRVCVFAFYDDIEGLHCRLVPCENGEVVNHEIAFNRTHIVDGDVRIDITDSPFVTANSGWHLRLGGKVNGIKIRKALWSLLT